MKFAILSRKPSLYSTRRLKEAGEARGHTMHVVDYLRCYMDITAHNPKVLYQGRPLEDIDAVIPRAEREELMSRYRAAAGFAKERLNAAPPTIPPGATVAPR